MADAHVWCVGGVTLNYINSASQGVEIINQVHAEFDCRGPLPVEFWCAYGNVVERTLVLPPPTEEMPQDATSQPSPPAASTTSQFSTLSTQPNILTETGTEEAETGTEEAARGTEEAQETEEEGGQGTEELEQNTDTENPEPDTNSSSTSPKNYRIIAIVFLLPVFGNT